jgi:hypothetical protein
LDGKFDFWAFLANRPANSSQRVTADGHVPDAPRQPLGLCGGQIERRQFLQAAALGTAAAILGDAGWLTATARQHSSLEDLDV